MPDPTPSPSLANFTFAGGVDEITDSRVVDPNAFLSATNVRYTSNGILDRRPGNEFLTNQMGSAPLAAGKGRVIDYNNSLVVTDGVHIGEYSSALGHVAQKDLVPEVTISSSPSIASSIYTVDTDIAVGNGVTLYVSS